MQHHLVYRSYGGGNEKDRPPYFSKMLALLSFVRAATQVGQAEVVFLNDGPIPTDLLDVMDRFGAVHQIPEGPVGMRKSYRWGLELPDRYSWPDEDVVSYLEDDYLFTEDAFLTLSDAVVMLESASYFTLYGLWPDTIESLARRPQVAANNVPGYVQVPDGWSPQPDHHIGDQLWKNVPSTPSTFSARVGALREDLDIFYQCMVPFRRRYLDVETCLLYQGQVPYRGRQILAGLPGDFVLSIRGVIRAAFLVPFRVALNARARRQRIPHYLYAPFPSAATHLTVGVITEDRDWVAEANRVADWAEKQNLVSEAVTLRRHLAKAV